MAFGVETEVPNTRVIIRQPDVIVNRSLIPIQPVAEFALSASYAQSASYLFGSIESASYATFALTASYVSGATSDWSTLANKPSGIVSSSTQILNYNLFAITGSNTFSGSQIISGTLDVLNGITGSFKGDGSQLTGLATDLQISGSTGNDVINLSTDVLTFSGSNGLTAAVSNNTVTYQLPSGVVSSSAQINSGSFTGSFVGDGSQLTGLVTDLRISGSTGNDVVSLLTDDLTITGQNGIVTTITDNTVTINVPFALTASLFGTASWASNAITASTADSITFTPATASFAISSSNAVTSSFAITSSYATNAELLDGLNSTVFATTGSNTFVGNQIISGSLITTADTMTFVGDMVVSGSLSVSGSLTGNLIGTASVAIQAISASYVDGGYY